MIFLNPDRTREECQEHLWNINAGQPHGINFSTFSLHFDQWWNKSKLEGESIPFADIGKRTSFNLRKN